jgi:hypothetical protein
MKLKQLFVNEAEIPIGHDIELDEKGKVTVITPDLKGTTQCPFWRHLKQSIAHRAEISEEVRIPRKFAEDAAKRFKVPLDSQYATPMCANSPKLCAYYGGLKDKNIYCSFGEKKTPPQEGQPEKENNKGEV